MSGTPNKRVHEDSGGHSSLSRYSHLPDDSGTFPGPAGGNSKLPNPNPSITSDYHAVSYDLGQDTRVPKVPRTELESRRSPLLQMYRMQPSSLNDTQSDHVVVNYDDGDNSVRDSKVESRDVKAESKDLYRKDTKHERDGYSDYRKEQKTDKEGYNPVNHRAWKYPESSSGNMDSWHTEEKDSNIDARETVPETDRKRKDAKHREGNKSNEMKDQIKEERGSEKWEKDKDKVKDHNPPRKLEQHEKEDADVSSSSKDLGKQKGIDNRKDVENVSKERRVEKDGDKDSDDGGADVDEIADKERDDFSYGVQQKKRMLRPRGSPQVANRDSPFRSRSQDNDGSLGKSDVSTVVYRVGECVQELLNLWKEYKSSSTTDKTSENAKSFPTLDVRIPAEHITATNRQVKGGQLWGTDIYTHDSDLVAVLMHTGYCRPTASPPPPAIQELRATIRVLPPQDCYVSTLRNNVRSRAWGAAIGCGCSLRVEKCHIVKKAGGTIDLEPCLTHTSTVEPTLAPVVVERTMTTRAAASNALRQQRFVREVTLQYNLCNEPWIKYSISAIADKGLKKPLFTSARLKKGEVLYLESPTRRYELCFNGEKMVKAGNETETNGVDTDNTNINNNNNYSNMMDVFRWSECKKPLPQTVMRSIGIPLPPEHLKVLEENLDWEDIQWSQTGVWICGKEYSLSRVHFLSPV